MQPPRRFGRPCVNTRAENLKARGTIFPVRQDYLQTLCLCVIQGQSFTDHHILNSPISSAQAQVRGSARPIPSSRSPGR